MVRNDGFKVIEKVESVQWKFSSQSFKNLHAILWGVSDEHKQRVCSVQIQSRTRGYGGGTPNFGVSSCVLLQFGKIIKKVWLDLTEFSSGSLNFLNTA